MRGGRRRGTLAGVWGSGGCARPPARPPACRGRSSCGGKGLLPPGRARPLRPRRAAAAPSSSSSGTASCTAPSPPPPTDVESHTHSCRPSRWKPSGRPSPMRISGSGCSAQPPGALASATARRSHPNLSSSSSEPSASTATDSAAGAGAGPRWLGRRCGGAGDERGCRRGARARRSPEPCTCPSNRRCAWCSAVLGASTPCKWEGGSGKSRRGQYPGGVITRKWPPAPTSSLTGFQGSAPGGGSPTVNSCAG